MKKTKPVKKENNPFFIRVMAGFKKVFGKGYR